MSDNIRMTTSAVSSTDSPESPIGDGLAEKDSDDRDPDDNANTTSSARSVRLAERNQAKTGATSASSVRASKSNSIKKKHIATQNRRSVQFSSSPHELEQAILARDSEITKLNQFCESITQQLSDATQRINELTHALNLERNVKRSTGNSSSSSCPSAGDDEGSDEETTLTNIHPFNTSNENDETVINTKQNQPDLGFQKVIGKAAKRKLAKKNKSTQEKSSNIDPKPKKPPIIVCSKGSIAKTTKEVREILGHRNFVINGAHVQTSSLADHNKLRLSHLSIF